MTKFVADTALIMSGLFTKPILYFEIMLVIIFRRLSEHGIRLEKSTPHEPWQNGKAENHINGLCNIASTNMASTGWQKLGRAMTRQDDVSKF